MLDFDVEDSLKKKLKILSKKDKVLARIFKRKMTEVINRDEKSIETYKNLKSPMNDYKRIHLTDNYVLLFTYFKDKKKVIFLDIAHRDYVYKK